MGSALSDEIVSTRLEGQAVTVSPTGEPNLDEIMAALMDGKAIDADSAGRVRIRDVQSPPDPGDLTTAEPAVDASGEPWLYVEAFTDAEFDMEVGFSDYFVHFHDVDVEQCIEFLCSLPGVTSAVRQDPEQILVVGTRDARRVRDSVIAWFAERA